MAVSAAVPVTIPATVPTTLPGFHAKDSTRSQYCMVVAGSHATCIPQVPRNATHHVPRHKLAKRAKTASKARPCQLGKFQKMARSWPALSNVFLNGNKLTTFLGARTSHKEKPRAYARVHSCPGSRESDMEKYTHTYIYMWSIYTWFVLWIQRDVETEATTMQIMPCCTV